MLPNQDSDGFTLVEVATSLVLLVVGLMPVAGLLLVCSNYRSDVETSYRLHMVAANRLEQLRSEFSTVTEYTNAYGSAASFTIDSRDVANLLISDVTLGHVVMGTGQRIVVSTLRR